MKDIHGYSKRLDQALARVARSSVIGERDKRLIERFSLVLRAQRISTGRVAKYACHLKKIAEMLPPSPGPREVSAGRQRRTLNG